MAASEEPITVAGQETRLIKTKMFFGNAVELLVVHLNRGGTYCVIKTEGMEPDAFKKLLATVDYKP